MTKKTENLVQIIIINSFAIAMGFVVYRLISQNLFGGGDSAESMTGAYGDPMGGTCKHPNQAVCKDVCENTMNGTYGDDKRCYDNNGMAISGGIFGDDPRLAPVKNSLSSQVDNDIISMPDSLSAQVNTSISNRIRPSRISANRSGFRF